MHSQRTTPSIPSRVTGTQPVPWQAGQISRVCVLTAAFYKGRLRIARIAQIHQGRPEPATRSVQVSQQLLCALGAPQFAERPLFDLADAFPGEMHVRADFGQRLRLEVSQAEPALNDNLLLFIQL